MEKLMRRLTLWSGLGFLVTGACYGLYPQRFLLTIVITLLVIFYQLGMRLIVGNWLEPRLQLRPSAAWLKVGARERRLYRLLRVRRWKKWLPTYSPAKYDVRQHSLADIIKTMTYAEVDHELMAAPQLSSRLASHFLWRSGGLRYQLGRCQPGRSAIYCPPTL